MQNLKVKSEKFLANLLFVLHCALGVFVLSGWFFPRVRGIYLAVLAVWLASWVFLGYCPLTRWEFLLRRRYGVAVDPNAEEIKYYLRKIFGVDIASKKILIGGLLVYVILVILTILS